MFFLINYKQDSQILSENSDYYILNTTSALIIRYTYKELYLSIADSKITIVNVNLKNNKLVFDFSKLNISCLKLRYILTMDEKIGYHNGDIVVNNEVHILGIIGDKLYCNLAKIGVVTQYFDTVLRYYFKFENYIVARYSANDFELCFVFALNGELVGVACSDTSLTIDDKFKNFKLQDKIMSLQY